ncbi:hypothetical protein INE86_01869 [Parabacteroides distasonis]|uniref:DUF6383 domain-containing protein n=1 Tax=Parabacteroides distasonis TaxID=823 RepID=UPI001BAA1360|nr:DUF6383 domain-containing protein [Parabacteroides distasonis]QUT53357.1 hypothetical protein INE86_01869 [Parabacteroides distasonis]
MKKIFTCISLAAATFMATTPVMAQQQKQLTDKEKAAVVKVIVPAVFDQVKQISGVDFMSLANPNIENVINSPLFLPQVSSLRADQLNTISATPDSLKLDLSSLDFSKISPPDYAGMGDIIAGLVNDVKLSFSNYKEYNVTVNGINVKIELPEKIDVSAAAMTDAETGIPANLLSILINTKDKGVILPFSSLSVELKLGFLGTLGSMMPNFPLKDGKLISLAENSNSTGTIDYNVTLEENLRSLSESLAQVPNFQVSVDMTKLMTDNVIKASLSGKPLQAPNAKLPMGDAVVYANLKSTTGMPADSIVLTSYDAASSKIKGYKKLTPTIGVSGANLVLTTTDSVRADVNTAWTPMSKQIVTMPATMSTAINSIMSSLVNGVVSNLKASAQTNYTITIDSIYEAKKDEVIRVMEIDATTKVEATSLKDTKMIVDINFLKGSNKENVMNIKATAPTNDTKITVDFSPAVDPKGDGIKENVNMATLYITSDAMGIITDNETISEEVQEVTVSTTASGLYVKNGKGNYVIVNMVGRVVSTGIITSDEQYISTPNMPNGIYMISIDQSKLLRSAHKTTVKFVK